MIDKNKAYRFRGDSERWVWDGGMLGVGLDSAIVMTTTAAEHLHERGILLEYPELPGEDWEFCDEKCGEVVWDEARGWVNRSHMTDCEDGIYCRKKKPVITEIEGKVIPNASDHYVYILCDSERDFLKDGDRVKVTKL